MQYSPKKRQDESQRLLREIRSMLVNDRTLQNIDGSQISDQQAQKYLSQSYQNLMSFKNKSQSLRDPALYYSKITQASKLIQNQNSMIKSYIKAKIQSEAFGSISQKIQQNDREQNSKEYQNLLKMKNQLQKKMNKERLEEYKKVDELIQKTKKYRRYQSLNERVPVLNVQRLVSQQGIDFQSIQHPQYKISSINNSIISPSTIKNNHSRSISRNASFISDSQDGIKLAVNMKKYLSKADRNRQQRQTQPIQIQIEEQSQFSFLTNTKKNNEDKVKSLLVRHPTFTKVFKGFLQQIIQVCDLDAPDKDVSISFTNIQKDKKINKKRFTYPAKQTHQIQKIGNVNSLDISQLTAKYQTKGMGLFSKQYNTQSKSSLFLLGTSGKIKKLINKRIGETNKYHLKQCIIKGDYLYYSDQQASSIQSSNLKQKRNPSSLDFISTILQVQKMKKIQISMEPLQIEKTKKEQGNILQSKTTDIQMVIIRGKDRNLYFQKNYAEGLQLCDQLIAIKLKKFHQMNCLLGMRQNKNMQSFILRESATLDFSHQYLRPKDQLTHQSYRKNFLSMLLQIFPNRKNTTNLNFHQCKLGLNELDRIINSIAFNFNKILQINFSDSKLDSKIVGQILKLIKKCPQGSTLQIKLNGCEINDQILLTNLANLSSVLNRIHKIDISHNPQITDKSVIELAKILSSKISQVKQIDLSYTSICQFDTIASLIKYVTKLKRLSVNYCQIRTKDMKKINQQFAKFIQSNNLASSRITIEMKNQESFQSVKDLDVIIKNTQHQYLTSISLPQNTKERTLISKYVCIQFDL